MIRALCELMPFDTTRPRALLPHPPVQRETSAGPRSVSGLLVTAVFESALPRGLKPIAAAMASYADDDGRNCKPSRARVAWNLDITSRQISRFRC